QSLSSFLLFVCTGGRNFPSVSRLREPRTLDLTKEEPMFKRVIYFMAAASFILGGVAAQAQDAGALLDLLVRKKLISDQEAEEVPSELTKQFTETPAGKWKMSTPITELEIYGDARLRYEYRGGETAGNVSQPNDWLERSRERYRLRIGLRGTLA